MTTADIFKKLPYCKPFLFVDEILSIDDDDVIGSYIFDENLDFYKGHFKNNPITPGVILIETMAQIGLVCLGIYLLKDNEKELSFALTSSEIEFIKPVLPNEKVTVISKKIYFRFNKLKCKVKMINSQNDTLCEGFISGMVLASLDLI